MEYLFYLFKYFIEQKDYNIECEHKNEHQKTAWH